MDLDYYVFHDVSVYHGNTILSHGKELINSVGGKSSEWKTMIKKMNPTLVYDVAEERLLIKINRGGQSLPVLNEDGLSKSEKTLVELLYGVLERELSNLQNPESSVDELVLEHDPEENLERLMLSAKEDHEFENDDPSFEDDNPDIDLR